MYADDIIIGPLKILFFIQEIKPISLVLAALLNFGGHLELPKDARLASIRFLIRITIPIRIYKTFSIDAIARSFRISAGLYGF